MQIEYREGNLLESGMMTIVHGCNSRGVMGSGIAKSIRSKWPEVYDRYKAAYDEVDGPLPLGCVVDSFANDGTRVLNAITQDLYGRDGGVYVDYDAIRLCFKKINAQLGIWISEIGMPQIGAGLGGGDWNKIATIIEQELTSIKPVVYIFR